MAKAIKHWLLATGLAERRGGEGRKRGTEVVLSAFGRQILEHDPYFNFKDTWAFVHVNMAKSEESTASWKWFLSSCAESVFTRAEVLEQFRRWAKFRAPKEPSPTTLQKDLNCLLSSYAQKVPADQADAEEATDCPLWELELLAYYRGSQRFRVNRKPKDLPSQVIGFALALSTDASESNRAIEELTFEEAAALDCGPGRTFLMGPSALYECVEEVIGREPDCPIQIGSQAGQRTIKYPRLAPSEWVNEFYRNRSRVYG